MKSVILTAFILTTLVPSGFVGAASNGNDALLGIWVRKSDHLRIKVDSQEQQKLYSFIVEEGTEKFPCDVNALPIYKNITQKGNNLWSCDFLVVTMGSCKTEYEAGMIRLTNDGDIEITCPGFEKKFYSKLKPRLENR